MQDCTQLFGISVIVCTFNRSELLKNLIRHFDLNVIVPKSIDLELLVVDNNSSDGTASLVQKERSRSREYYITYLMEKKQGLSFARNSGILAAKYDWTLFLDDDAIPCSNFFENLLVELRQKKNVSAFCCKVITRYRNIPDWYPIGGKYKLPLMGMYDLGDESRFLKSSDPPPIGSGIILKKIIFQKYGYFDHRFGYNQKRSFLVPGEDTRLTLAIIEKEEPFYYIGNCLINHFPPRNKLGIRTLSRIYFGQGFLFGIQDYEKHGTRAGLKVLKIPGWYIKELLSTSARSLNCRFRGDRTGFYFYYLHLLKILGRYWGYIQA